MGGTAKIELMLELKNKMSAGLNQAKKDTFKGVGEMQGKANGLKIELKNKVKTGLSQAKKDTSKGVDEIQAKMNGLKSGITKNSKAIADEVPMIGNAFRLVKNPIALTAAGIVAIGKGIDYTTQKAATFNTQFRTLANLNLDKSKKEIESLRHMVLDTSYNKGFDTNKTITGYFDVQSTTGKFGDEVRRIVEKQGEFANLMQADFNNYIAGTAKGMANFGFGQEKLEEYNRSAYATVKVGVTTFDQLAQVQSVYAGAAAANNQTFDTANKMLALFTVKTKSVDEAATLTKSMFNDLTKDATIKAFKKVGISIYDNNGAIKQGDTLMLELNKKFAGLDKDKKVVDLKNQFTGSEGLIAMIQAATDKSGQLQSTFNNFNSTKLDMDKAIELAQNDVNYKTEVLRNKLNVVETEIGTALLPLKVKIAELKLAAVELANALVSGRERTKRRMYSDGWTKQNEQYSSVLNSAASLSPDEYKRKHSELLSAMNVAKDVYLKSVGNTTRTPLPWGGGTLWSEDKKKEYKEDRNGYSTEYTKGKYEAARTLLFDFQKEWQTKTNFGRNVLEPLPPAGSQSKPNGDGSSATTTLGDNLDAVTGSARQIRNLTVNIEAFNKGGINTANTSLQHMEPSAIEEWFKETCMSIVHSIESSY